MGRPWPRRVSTIRYGCGQARWTLSSIRPATASASSRYRTTIASAILAWQTARRYTSASIFKVVYGPLNNGAAKFGERLFRWAPR